MILALASDTSSGSGGGGGGLDVPNGELGVFQKFNVIILHRDRGQGWALSHVRVSCRKDADLELMIDI